MMGDSRQGGSLTHRHLRERKACWEMFTGSCGVRRCFRDTSLQNISKKRPARAAGGALHHTFSLNALFLFSSALLCPRVSHLFCL